jgi:hypothetical protein
MGAPSEPRRARPRSETLTRDKDRRDSSRSGALSTPHASRSPRSTIASDGKLKPLVKSRLEALPRRREHRGGFLGTLRAGLAERDQLFNVVALGPQRDA